MIKAIFFDFDGVMTTDSRGLITILNNLEEKTGVDREALERCYGVFNAQHKRGEVVYADVWDEFCACIGKDVDVSIMEYVSGNIRRNEPMFELVASLHSQYKTGVISSNSNERFDVIKKQHDLDSIFDVYVSSADVAASKHEGGAAKLFQRAMELTGLAADECIFIDNHEKNLTVPNEMGFKTYWHDDAKNDIEALQKQLGLWGVKA